MMKLVIVTTFIMTRHGLFAVPWKLMKSDLFSLASFLLPPRLWTGGTRVIIQNKGLGANYVIHSHGKDLSFLLSEKL